MKNTLQQIFNEIGNLTPTDYGANDKGGQIHTYLEKYDELFAPFKNGCTIIELGLAQGDSIKLWDRYFKFSDIIGVDLSIIFDYKQEQESNNKITLIAGDATKANFLNEIKGKAFDIVIDDASHLTQDQLDTFNLLKGKMNKGGIYIIEDILALDIERSKYERLHSNCEIIDMRSNGRFDNILIVYRF
jgi:23S rRNA U2552 (ribose-2'-O)-methylase RlmE/FtsJ